MSDIVRLICQVATPGVGVTITGGEPFQQPQALLELVRELSPHHGDILVYSGYRLAELLAMHNPTIEP